MVLNQDWAFNLYNLWNKYDYSYDFALSSVQKSIIEIQQFFHCKAKQVFHASFTKIGRLRRELQSLQHLQQRRPYSTYISSRVIEVGNQILELQKVSVDSNIHVSKEIRVDVSLVSINADSVNNPTW